MDQQYLTVTALNKYLKFKFDNDKYLGKLLLKAEISNFKRHSRGHLYFTLKDESSQIAAVMFSQDANRLRFSPKDGDSVFVEGRVSIYEAQGNYQIYVTELTLSGIGDLYLRYEQLKTKLAAQGLFDPARKRTLPLYPQAIGVITSDTGAAVRDIIYIINRRYPLAKIFIYPTLVQGDQAAKSIVKSIEKANLDHYSDVLIVGRGGGSIEDLWPFNEEIVAYAIRDSRIPIVSAVGHETDFTIADFVSDLRAPTPSGAAEIVVPDQMSLFDKIAKIRQKLDYYMSTDIRKKRVDLIGIISSPIFADPTRLLEKNEMRLSSLVDRLNALRPDRSLDIAKERTQSIENRLFGAIQKALLVAQTGLVRHLDKLEVLNPLSLMKKGYAVVNQQDVLITGVAQLAVSNDITVRFSDGSADCRVQTIRKDDC